MAAGTAFAGVRAPRAAGAGVVERLRAAAGDLPVAPTFVSRPDLLPPPISIVMPYTWPTRGHILLAPFSFPTSPPSTEASGPLIIDRNGQPLWFRPLTGRTAIGLRVQNYRGDPVLTWWEGTVFGGYGGTFVIADASYARVARVRAGNGYRADLHEILITSRNTALISIYNEIRTDLSRIGGPVDGRLVEGVIQEIEIPSGRVLFEWHSLDHIALEESSELAVTGDGNVDYLHLNSIGVDTDGHLLVSARHTSAVYKVHRRTGAVIWRLGGTRSDFALGPGVSFGYQHDARRHSDGTLTIFDNAASLPTQRGVASRTLRLRLEMSAKKATLVRDYVGARDPHVVGDGERPASRRRRHLRRLGHVSGLQRDRAGWSTPLRRALRRNIRELSGSSATVGRAAGNTSRDRHIAKHERIDPGLYELERRDRGGPLAGAGGLERESPAAGTHRHAPGVRDRSCTRDELRLRRRRCARPEGCAARRVEDRASLTRSDGARAPAPGLFTRRSRPRASYRKERLADLATRSGRDAGFRVPGSDARRSAMPPPTNERKDRPCKRRLQPWTPITCW